MSHSDRHEPNERQDIHLALGGLDPEREIAFIDISVPDGHRWQYNTAPGYWKIELQRRKGATVADLFVEPKHRDGGAVWHVLVRYDDNSTAEADVRSRKADPFLRVPSLSVQARWIGQDRLDLTGLGTGVGPDGLQDVRLHLTGLSQKLGVKAIRVEMAGGSRWESGVNSQLLNHAELVKDEKDPHQADFFLQPDREMTGQRLRLRLLYDDGSPDGTVVAAGRCNPNLRMPQGPLPKIEELAMTAQWLGQDGSLPLAAGRRPRGAGATAILEPLEGHLPDRHVARGLAVSQQRPGAGAARWIAGGPRGPAPARSRDGRFLLHALSRCPQRHVLGPSGRRRRTPVVRAFRGRSVRPGPPGARTRGDAAPRRGRAMTSRPWSTATERSSWPPGPTGSCIPWCSSGR